jgi:membrane protein implicated in regulation of membrane protease activity
MIGFLLGLSLCFIILDFFLWSKVLTHVGFAFLAMVAGSFLSNSWLFQIIYAFAIWAVLLVFQYWIWNPMVEKINLRFVGTKTKAGNTMHNEK